MGTAHNSVAPRAFVDVAAPIGSTRQVRRRVALFESRRTAALPAPRGVVTRRARPAVVRPADALVDVDASAVALVLEAWLTRARVGADEVHANRMGPASACVAVLALVDVEALILVLRIGLEAGRATAPVGPRRVGARSANGAVVRALGALVDVEASTRAAAGHVPVDTIDEAVADALLGGRPGKADGDCAMPLLCGGNSDGPGVARGPWPPSWTAYAPVGVGAERVDALGGVVAVVLSPCAFVHRPADSAVALKPGIALAPVGSDLIDAMGVAVAIGVKRRRSALVNVDAIVVAVALEPGAAEALGGNLVALRVAHSARVAPAVILVALLEGTSTAVAVPPVRALASDGLADNAARRARVASVRRCVTHTGAGRGYALGAPDGGRKPPPSAGQAVATARCASAAPAIGPAAAGPTRADAKGGEQVSHRRHRAAGVRHRRQPDNEEEKKEGEDDARPAALAGAAVLGVGPGDKAECSSPPAGRIKGEGHEPPPGLPEVSSPRLEVGEAVGCRCINRVPR